MLKGLAADLTGSADICRVLADLGKAGAADYLLPQEELQFVLQAAKEEFAFTNQALLTLRGESSTTTRKVVERFDYKSHIIAHVRFETAGVVDRDCEIKFMVGDKAFSIDVAKGDEPELRVTYKVLELISRKQKENERSWEFGRLALDASSTALWLTEGSSQTLTKQSDETLAWIQELYARTHPRCYRDVIASAFQAVRAEGKMAS